MADITLFEKQLDDIVAEYEAAKANSKYDDCSDVLKEQDVKKLHGRCLAAIDRVVGKTSVYYETAMRVFAEKNHAWGELAGLVGVVQSLLFDLRNGYLKSLEELIHADVFADFLEMAEHLTDSGYKDAAAVIAGSTLEAHLRKLAAKHGLNVTSGGKPTKADTLNAEIVKVGGYSKLDQKNVTAWLGLRNDAAHGNYSAYDKNQVTLLLAGIRDFIVRNPA
jgi:hypothetical protein